jgi:sugar lactone lactonase YvrE
MKASIIHISGVFLLLSLCINVNAGIFDNLQPVKLATGMQFTEGPAWYPDGFIVFSDIDGNKIFKWSESAGLEPFAASVGNPNGIVCSKRNEFFVCRHTNRDIAKMSSSSLITSLVSNYKGKKFNSPNDLELSYMGSIYFTDPDFGANTSTRELSYQGLFCIPYDKTEAVLLDSTLVKPNGLTFSNDWHTLYVCESSTNNIYSYYLRDESVIQDITKDKRLFVKVSGTGEIDGITSDVSGNIYVAFGDGGIKIFDKDAREVGLISFPAGEKVRNLCFGGKYKNILFVTAGTSLYKVEIRFNGDFITPGLLGIPTDKSVVFNALSDKTLEAYIAYGTSAGSLSQNTATIEYPANVPAEITLSNLTANTQYFYKLYYRIKGETAFIAATSGSFYTQRAAGSVFSFAVEADPHLDEGSNYLTFRNTLQNALNLKPDFLIDLGDNFMVEKYPIVNSYYIEQRSLFYRNFWDNVCHSMPLFIAQGNHDTELRWLSQNSASDPFNTATSIRKLYYPTPEPDGFYTGSSAVESFVGKRENYYAWNWGDALFVVIDPYGYTETKTNDPWCFTLGKTQYDWFRATLEGSKAKYKFVFAHQLVGGDYIGRGGAEKADYFENGGLNADGTYGFDDKRPGWGKPLHQLMVENGVQIYFHGHDHFYAEQVKDGIIYQEVPQPSFPGYTVVNDAANFGYTTGTILPNSGHIQVTVLKDSAKVDYIGGYHAENKALGLLNGVSRRTYYVKANSTSTSANPMQSATTTIKAYCADNFLYVNAPYNMDAQVNLYSITGQSLGNVFKGYLQQGNNVLSLPDNYRNAMYLVTIRTENSIITLKIIR